MTIVGSSAASGLGLTPVSRLKKYRFGLTRDYGTSDSRQVPVGDAEVTVYKQGAHASSAGSISPGGDGTIMVYDVGQIRAGDTVFHEVDTSITAYVDSITTDSLVVSNVAGGTLSWAIGGRFRASTNLPVLYSDIHSGGEAIDNPMPLDARGLAECYAVENIVDAIIEGSSIGTVSIYDEVGAFPLAEVRYADAFPGDDWGEKLAAALADLDETYGGIVDCRGLRGFQAAVTADPFAGVTWPYTVILGHAVYQTDVALAAALDDYQAIVGSGIGQSILRASIAFPSSSALLTLGHASGAIGARVRGVTLDCNGVASSVGLHLSGCRSGSKMESLEVLNAKLYGVRLNNTLFAARDISLRNLRVETSNSSAVGVIFDSGCGPNNSLEGLYAESASGITGIAAVQKAASVPVRICDVSAVRYTSAVYLSAVAGGADISTIYGDSTLTNVLKVDAGSPQYSARNLVRNSATNVLNDANLPAAYTNDVIDEFVMGQTVFGIPNGISPGVDLVIPSGATAADYAIRERINGTDRFALRKDGVLKLSKISNELGHTPTTGTIHANFGAGASVTLQAGSTDMAGNIVISTGTGCGANPTFVLTFGEAYPTSVRAVIVCPFIDSGIGFYGAGEFWMASATTSNNVTIMFAGTPDDSKSYRIAYLVICGAT